MFVRSLIVAFLLGAGFAACEPVLCQSYDGAAFCPCRAPNDYCENGGTCNGAGVCVP